MSAWSRRSGAAILSLERAYTELFGVFVSLDTPEPVYLQTAQLRAGFTLRAPDALHLACAQHHRCEALWTNDNRLQQGSQGSLSMFCWDDGVLG